MLPLIQKALTEQGCTGPDHARYGISVDVKEGAGRPCKDVDNYYKPIIDTVTYTKLLWHDDEQVDELAVRRSKLPGQPQTEVLIDIRRLTVAP
jgi:Holliday junction resolvase RusA-like endonuclease